MKDLLSDVHQDMNASFCWFFQQIFSSTPTLMLSVMLLLANFAVNSMSTATNYYNHLPSYNNIAIAGSIEHGRRQQKQQPRKRQQLKPNADPGIAGAWKEIVEKADMMKGTTRHKALMDKETLQEMVAPVTTLDIHKCIDDVVEHFRRELTYQTAVSADLENTLLLCNYAQFLYLVVQDHTKAEHYFKRAVEVTPVGVESLSLYANFLWVAKNDLCGAEKTYLMAMDEDPDNSSLAANYANFLWNTGGEDTCFLLDA